MYINSLERRPRGLTDDGFSLDEMNDDFAATFVWAYAFLFVCSFTGEIIQTKKVVIIVRPIKTIIQFNLCFISKYISISQIETNCLGNVHASPDFLSTLLLLQQGNAINYNKKFCMASPEAVIKRCSIKKLLLKLRTGKYDCRSLFNKVVGHQTCNIIKKRLQYRCFPVNFAEFLGTSINDCFCISSTRLQQTTPQKLLSNIAKQ